MAVRIRPRTLEECDEKTRALFGELEALGGYVPNMHRTFAAHAKLYQAWLPFATRLMPRSTLPARDRQLLILRTAWRHASEYVFRHHAQISLQVSDLGADEVEATRAPDPPRFSAHERALLRAVDELKADSRISEETWRELAARYSEQQLVDAVFTVGQYALISCALNSFGTELEPDLERLQVRRPRSRS
jgi:alkylhydroperoxidase family enzyme